MTGAHCPCTTRNSNFNFTTTHNVSGNGFNPRLNFCARHIYRSSYLKMQYGASTKPR